jgi:hypothetical protein
MGDLKRGIKRGFKSVRKAVSGTWESMKEGSKKIGETLGYESAGITPKSDKTKRMLAEANAQPPAVPMPDEEELRKARRRRIASQPRAGRASTILSSDEDTLG